MDRIVFLDRDGVINNYPGYGNYITEWKEFKFLPKSKKAIKRLTEAGYKIFVISNQAGVAKKIFSKEKLKEITERMLEEITESKGKIKGVFYCTHKEEDNCSCRKPKIGLIQRAIKGKRVDLKDTYFIGDSLRDIETSKNAGCKSILVVSGEIKEKDIHCLPLKPDFIAKDLLEATEIIIRTS